MKKNWFSKKWQNVDLSRHALFLPLPFLLTGMISLIGTLPATTKATSLQEGIELRRIAEYCKEKNYHAVKTQIQGFLNKHPHSDSSEGLYAMLGDIFFTESDFQSALSAYDHVKKETFTVKTEFRRIHCLHQLSRFNDVITAANVFLKRERTTSEELLAVRMQLANALLRQSLAAEDTDNKHKFLHLSKDQFKLLAQTEYADQTLAPLAHIHSFLKEYSQAVRIYHLLMDKDPKNKEEYLLQILQLQVKFDRPAAIDTCQKIYTLNGPAAPHAAFNQLSLLFQEHRYRDIALFQEKVLQFISHEHLPMAHYYIGKSLHHIGDFAQASRHLEKYVSNKGDDALRTKNALLTMLQCAKEMDDLPSCEKNLSHIKTAFPQDVETIKASLLYAQLCRNKGYTDKSAQALKELLDTFQELPEKDSILYNYALLLYQEQKWLDSASAFETFIKQFPSHPEHQNAWRNAIQCYVHSIKEASSETAFVKKEKLCNVIHCALREKSVFLPEERKKMRFMLAVTWYEIHKYENCLQELSEYMKDYPSDMHTGEAYTLAALVHYHGSKDLDLFTFYAEKALSVRPTLPEATALHLNLFNTYLSLASQKDTEAKSTMMLKAADHLYQVLDQSIKTENQLWLADFYFHQYKESSLEHAEPFLDRAIVVLEKILNFTAGKNQISFATDKIEREAQAVKLADLYGAKKKNQERICILRALTEEYERHPDCAWKYRRLTHFDLATAYKEEKNYEMALAAYNFLIASSSHATSYFSIAAELDKTLLEFSLLDSNLKKEDTPEMQAICDSLKNLEIKRRLFSEPCHLEAALSYIDITTSLSADQQLEQRMHLLDQLKFNFSCLDDPLVQQYLSTQMEFPEKHQLYLNYMDLISAEIVGIQAMLAYRNGERDQCLALKDKATDQLFVLYSQTAHPRLKERIERSREALKQIL